MSIGDKVILFQASVKKFQISVLTVLVAARQLKATDNPDNRAAFGRAVASMTISGAAVGIEGVELVRSTPAGRVAADLSGIAGLADSAANLVGVGIELEQLLDNPSATQAAIDAKLLEVLWGGAAVVADTASIVVPQLRIAGKAGKVLGTWAPAALGVLASAADAIGELSAAREIRRAMNITERGQSDIIAELELRAVVTHQLAGGGVIAWDLNPDDT